MRKHKIFAISLTVGDRAISAKFSTPRVFKEYTTPTFEKFSEMAAILNFCRKSAKTQNCLYLLNRERWNNFVEKFSAPRVSKQYTQPKLKEIFVLSKNGGHFEF